MKAKTRFFYLFLIAGLLFTSVTSCDKNEVPDDQSVGQLVDADGNVYKTVNIGSQVWMAENLKTTKYNDGTEIANVTDYIQWGYLSTGAYCNYDTLESYVASYGRLYNGYAIITGKLAPAGWHVPTYEDWTILENYLIANGYNYDGSIVEPKFAKSLASTTDWSLSEITGTPGAEPEENNSTGFTALPGSSRGINGMFGVLGKYGIWWSSTACNNQDCLTERGLGYDYNFLSGGESSKSKGHSVRLVKNN